MKSLLRPLARAGLGLLPQSRHDQLFRHLASRRGVRFVIAEGEYGAFEGALKDRANFGQYLATGRYAPHLVHLFRSFFNHRGSGTFIDIGAHVGFLSVAVTECPNVRAIAIEAEPVNFGCLERNVLRNGRTDRITLINRAVFNAAGEISLELSDTNLGDHRIRMAANGQDERHQESRRRVVSVQADSLDNLLGPLEVSAPLAIKMDIQGGEALALQGATRTMAIAELLITEFWPYAIARTGASLEVFFADLASAFAYGKLLGHAGEVATSGTLQPIAHIVAELREQARVAPTQYTDLLLSKSPRIAGL